jgi:ATP-dependent exoDNAse (exonuclease V) alpha subunit
MKDKGPHIPVAFSRKQFPVRLAFAMTVNKSQGQQWNGLVYSFHKMLLAMISRRLAKHRYLRTSQHGLSAL